MRSHLFTAPFLIGALVAQTDWSRIPLVSTGIRSGIAYDQARDRMVYHHGLLQETWEWDGTNWQRFAPAVLPKAGAAYALVYDPVRQRVVLHGGTGPNGILGETWEWDGAQWYQRPPTPPTARLAQHAMAYDVLRQRMVTFGGQTFGSTEDETWESNGVNWSLAQSAVKPGARRDSAMAYDPLRQCMVLFGGVASSGGNTLGDTWTWDGIQWTRKTPVTNPPPRANQSMHFDPRSGTVLMFGGAVGGSAFGSNELWEWTGADWRQLANPNPPPPRALVASTFDTLRNRSVFFGGFGARNYSDLWSWDGLHWQLLAPSPQPRSRVGNALWFDDVRQMVYSFGGSVSAAGSPLADTARWDGSTWIDVTPPTANSPGARTRSPVAFDRLRGRGVLFGGSGPGQDLADTWEHDGTQWTPCNPALAPSPRSNHAMTFDAARGRTVLFGGFSLSTLQRNDETWLWDGAAWTKPTPAIAPSPRHGASLAYDGLRRRVVLFGGSTSSGPANDTWEWDGAAWVARLPTQSPPPTTTPRLTFDSERSRTVLVLPGGNGLEAWEWDGNNWLLRTTPNVPIALSEPGVTFDAPRHQVLLFGGTPSSGGSSAETYRYFATALPTWRTFGSGCATSAGAPRLATTAGGLPFLSDTFTVTVSPLPLGRPVAMLLGASDTTWSGIPLPFDLGAIGMPGCTLYVSGEVVVPLFNVAGVATWNMPICNCPWLVGSSFFHQAHVVDPTANLLGIAVSDAGAARVGVR